MSVQAMTWVLEQVRGVSSTERLVLLSIANHADKHGANAWPSHATIGEEADCRIETVRRAIRALKKRCLLEVAVNAGGDNDTPPDRRPNRYRLSMKPYRGGAPGAMPDAQRTPAPPDDGWDENAHPSDNGGGARDGYPRDHDGCASDASTGGRETHTKPSLNRPTTPPTPPQAGGEHEPVGSHALHQALLLELGIAADATLTPREARRLRSVVANLTRIGATPGLLHLAARAYRARFSVPLTAFGLERHWHQLLAGDPFDLDHDDHPDTVEHPHDDCATCNGSTWVLDEHGEAGPCPGPPEEAAS